MVSSFYAHFSSSSSAAFSANKILVTTNVDARGLLLVGCLQTLCFRRRYVQCAFGNKMERILKKYEQKYRRAKELLIDWKELQGQRCTLFSSACSIFDRLPVLLEEDNFGVLKDGENMAADLLAKQVESLEYIFQSMSKILMELENVSNSFEKLWQDGCSLLRAERPQPTPQQRQQRIGSRPSLNDCLDGLEALHIMHHNEYKVKVDIISS